MQEFSDAGAGSPARTTANEYYPHADGARYIVGRVARTVLTDPTAGQLRESQNLYDGNTDYNQPPGAYGHMAATRLVLDGTRCVDVTFVYDGYGRATSQTEYGVYGTPRGALASGDPRTTTVVYDTLFQTYPVQVTNPLGQVASRTYDGRWGLVLSATDINGAVTSFDYDTFARLQAVHGPQVNGYRKKAAFTYGLPGVTNGRTVSVIRADMTSEPSGGATGPSAWSVYDGVGRVLQSYVQADATNGVNVVNSYYDQDGRGLAWRRSVAHSATGTGAFLESDWSRYSGPDTRSVFDELGRPTRVTGPDGQIVTTQYDGWAATGTDANGHQKRTENDWAGRPVAVREYSGSAPNTTLYASTTYSFDAANQLGQVHDAAGNQTTLSAPG